MPKQSGKMRRGSKAAAHQQIFQVGAFMYWHTGWYVLALAILSEKYMCPEKAFYVYLSTGTERQRYPYEEWMPPGMLDEMRAQRKLLGNKKAAELYGIDKSNFCRITKGV